MVYNAPGIKAKCQVKSLSSDSNKKRLLQEKHTKFSISRIKSEPSFNFSVLQVVGSRLQLLKLSQVCVTSQINIYSGDSIEIAVAGIVEQD